MRSLKCSPELFTLRRRTRARWEQHTLIILRILAIIAGSALLLSAPFSAMRTFLVPRGTSDWLTKVVFLGMRYVFAVVRAALGWVPNEVIAAYFAPASLLTLPIVWLACLLSGYTVLYWGLLGDSLDQAFSTSRLSLFALASNIHNVPGGPILPFSETALSVLLAAILVSYLPTIYSAFSQRETAVTGLETRAGSPASPEALLIRYYAIHGFEQLSEMWTTWQEWFEQVEETHLALQPLTLYRSPQPGRSWITAAGAVLDTAAIVASTVEGEHDPGADLCIRAGYLCLRRICTVFGIPHDENPTANDPISVTKAEFLVLYEKLETGNVPLKSDRDECWRNFSGWRVNYDIPLVALCALTWAPPGPWSSDRLPAGASEALRADKLAKRLAQSMLAARDTARWEISSR